ncbi:hypothetical protein EXVG_00441 [Emiliania huxleyi virus 202]|nr:hypothetical protein EXVG_00441 [Emiliania huxleyi virus 202]
MMMQRLSVPEKPYIGKRKVGYDDSIIVNPSMDIPTRPTKRICSHSTTLKAVDVLANSMSVTKTTGQLARMNTNSVRIYLKDTLRPAIDEIEHILSDTDGKLKDDLNDALEKAYECETFSMIHISEQHPAPVVSTSVSPVDDAISTDIEYESETGEDYYEVDVNYDTVCGEIDPFDIDAVADAVSDHIETESGMDIKPILVTVNLPDWIHIDLWNDVLHELTTRYTEVEIDHMSSSDDCSVFTIAVM